MADTLVLPYAERLLACLCTALEDTLGGVPCQCSLRPGTAPPPADACCACENGQGQASVQVTDIFAFPAGKFPSRGGLTGTLTNCGEFEWAAELTMTVYRCVSAVDGDTLPSVDEMMTDARKILDDAQAMRHAVLCCSWRAGAPPPGRTQADPAQIVIGPWRSVNPMGGCAGGMLSVTVALGTDCCPAEAP